MFNSQTQKIKPDSTSGVGIRPIPEYPAVRRDETVVEDYHGTKVNKPR